MNLDGPNITVEQELWQPEPEPGQPTPGPLTHKWGAGFLIYRCRVLAGTVVADIERKEGKDGRAELERRGWDLPVTLRLPSRNGEGVHAYYAGDAAVLDHYICGLDRRGTNSMVFVCHLADAGRVNTRTLPPAPAWLMEQESMGPRSTCPHCSGAKTWVKRDAWGRVSAPGGEEGRHQQLQKRAAGMRNDGMEEDEILEGLEKVRDSMGWHDKPDGELRRLATWAAGKDVDKLANLLTHDQKVARWNS